MKTFVGVVVSSAVLFLTLAGSSMGQEIEVTTILDTLNNPCGVAIQPETGDVFVAESGALRIFRLVDGKAQDVITGFPRDVYGKGPMYEIGPLGLCFIDKDTLVVGGGGKKDGEELLRVYKIPPAGSPPIKADQMHGDAKMLAADGEVPGEGNFYGLARANLGVFVTCNGDDEQGWVSLATFDEDLKLEEFSRSIATKKATSVDAPVAITMSPQGELVVGQMGEISKPGDSLLTFYSEEGKLLGNFKTSLNDISGLAYGPQHGRLFALDFNWGKTSNGGLYKLIGEGEDRTEGCKAKLVKKLTKPTALAFTPKGDLYIVLAGDMSEAIPKLNGKLLLLKGVDVDPNKDLSP